VVKDPVSLKYFRWGEREYQLAQLLDGKRNAAELVEQMKISFPSQQFEAADLQRFFNQFLTAGLLVSDGGTAQRLFQRLRQETGKRKKQSLWLTLPGKLISFKITLFDPDLLLLRMSKRLRFLWSWPAAVALLLLLFVAGWMLTSDAANLASRMPDILGWQNLLIMWLVLIFVKVVHEFGHGLSCKHYGGEVHEMGAMFILFSPFLFCNATDSWVFKEKGKRLVVNFGGIYLELFLAAAAAMLWVLTPGGIFNQICFNVMLVCSVMTIFFNANPLMKFDGYYALSDWMEIPNLKERGDKMLVSRVAGLFTGGSGVVRDPLGESVKGKVMIYAVASYMWTFMVAYNILIIVGHILEPAGLDRLAQSVAAITLFAGILTPPFLVCMQVFRTAKNDTTGQVKQRTLKAGLLAVAVLFVVSAIPVTVKVRCAGVIDGANRARVTAQSAGFIREVKVRDGMRVKEGQVLAVLENRELLADLAMTLSRLQEVRVQESLIVGGEVQGSASGLRALRAQYEASAKKLEGDKQALQIRAPVAGTVMGKDLAARRGTLLRTGELLVEILPEGAVQAVAALSEKEANMVRPDEQVVFLLHSRPGREFSGRVLSVDVSPVRQLPHQSLGQQAGGTVPSIMAPNADASALVAVPASTIYKARVELDNEKEVLRPGMSGRLKIECGRKPLAFALWDRVTSMIRTDFQL
jgi:putative peptide zinc metalloprotease protein